VSLLRVVLLSVALALSLAATALADATVVVKLAPRSVARLHAAERRLGAREVGTISGLDLRVVRVPGDAAAAARRLDRVRGVRWAEADVVLHAAATPSDPLFGATPLAGLGASAAWDALGLGAFPARGGVRIGLVDTGVDASHEDLRDRVVACAAAAGGVVTDGGCADVAGHGTALAGVLAATANNGVGIAGLAFSSPLVSCRALGPDGAGAGSDVAACIRWTHSRGAKVIVLGLAGPASRAVAEAVDDAWGGGHRGSAVVVAASGNDGGSAVRYPAGLANVVSVGAVDRADAVAPFSVRNADVELTAPGVEVVSTRAGGGYAATSGTSLSAAFAAGAAALLWDEHRRSAASTIRRHLDALVRDLGAPGRDPAYGFGRLDLTPLG